MSWQDLKEALTELFHYFSLGGFYREDLELRPVPVQARNDAARRSGS